MNWFINNWQLVADLTLAHLLHSLIPIALGLVIAIPIGALADSLPRLRGLILGATSLAYVIPSLALFALLPPLLGISFLSELNLIIALTIYAVATQTRYVAEGLGDVDKHTLVAATAIGYGRMGRLWRVHLPLAGPSIVAGLRVTAVSTISLATVGALIGADNLGYLFTNGYQRRIEAEIITGIIVVALLAVVIDRLIVATSKVVLQHERV